MQFNNTGTKIFYSVFHAVSAFCNSGITLLPNGFKSEGMATAYTMHLAFIILVLVGALGFPALRDLFGTKNLRDRLKLPWKQWKTSTVVSVYATVILTIGGGLIFLLLESKNTMSEMNMLESVISAVFHATSRTAGFQIIDINSMMTSTLILLIFLMFIGGSSGSVAGGIKTSTFIVILFSVIATIRGRKQIEFGRKSISDELLYRSFAIFVFSAISIQVTIILLAVTDPQFGILSLTFEAVSAFSVSGYTTGITSSLSIAGQTIVMLSTIVGRIGTLTLAFALSSPQKKKPYSYPETRIMVG
ncbi:MAG: TrkH family potassium uptake protein [Bacteroidetes bacterium]|nr:TrkH family potassium uptake protein [Bacteroidota bacterium]